MKERKKGIENEWENGGIVTKYGWKIGLTATNLRFT